METRFFLAAATFAILTLVRAADVATTLHFDPQLHHEGNPVVHLLGGGAATLVVLSVFVWLLLTIFLAAFWRGDSLCFQECPSAFWKFIRAWNKRVVKPRRNLRSNLPGGRYWREGLQAIRLFGLALPWAIIVSSVAAVHAWAAMNGLVDAGLYQKFFATFGMGTHHFVWLTTPFGFLSGTALFFWSEFREQLKRDRQAA